MCAHVSMSASARLDARSLFCLNVFTHMRVSDDESIFINNEPGTIGRDEASLDVDVDHGTTGSLYRVRDEIETPRCRQKGIAFQGGVIVCIIFRRIGIDGRVNSRRQG